MPAWGSIPGFHRVLKRDSFYYSRLLQCHSSPKSVARIHAQIIATGHGHNPFLASKLVSRYTDLGGRGIDDARRVFDRAPQRDILLWNVMIRSYANSGPQTEAIILYCHLRRTSVRPNCYTYPFVIKACAALGDENEGRAVHADAVRAGLDSDLFVSNALVAFYAKCCEIETARNLFDEIPVKDLVSWNSMIAGYSQNDCAYEAIALLHQMLREDVVTKPDRVTIAALLPACAALAAVQEGMWAHSYVIKTGMEMDARLGSGLVSMYANCGRLDTAQELFERVREPNLILYNSIIRAYGMHGHAKEAVVIFSKMLEMGIEPDGICFICALSACSHAGMVHEGFEIFEMMDSYGVEKGQVHYACMVDLLGRAGQLRRAVEFIGRMPVDPGGDVWGALLGACRIYNDIELAEEAAKKLFLLDPENAGRYAALAKMYEDVGRWEDAARVRKALRDRGVRKPLGCSMVEVDTEVHTFGVEDESHPMTAEIYVVLEQLQKLVVEDEIAAIG
ncbi:pentatricopeptide repeat-containing protein CRR2, chloroplastic [Elaeis guineensis]|uniref:Pentatricopeptide repeat-containing protein At3g46790, chloroplastic n=1 Tax=Elaeis guineensis var. tenera TaxID=51953 RepID=A0A6I9RZH8_ELAGV|nr:pentatricopeptide repeat-containing protein At3g46790, chloroplastic [Elaeis guineensis]